MQSLIEIALDPSRPNAADRAILKQYADSFSTVVVLVALGGVALVVVGQILRGILS